MFNRMKLKLAATAAALLVASAAYAQDEWLLGSVGAPGSALAGLGEMVAEGMTKAGNGEFTVTRQFIGNEQEMVQQVLRGRVQVGATSAQGLGVAVPDGTVLAFPFLWDSVEQRDYVTQKHVLPVLDELLAEKGLKLLAVADAGFYGVFCQFDCHDPETLKGVKVRVSPTPAANLFWSNVGANAVQLPLSELWPGLEQNLVRAADIPLPFYLTTPARESAPHFVKTNHFHAPWIFFMNKALWEGLSPAQQQAITDNLPPVEELLAVYAAEIAKAEESFKAGGGNYYELTPELDAKWRAGIAERLPELLASMGDGAKRLYETIDAGKAEFAKQPAK